MTMPDGWMSKADRKSLLDGIQYADAGTRRIGYDLYDHASAADARIAELEAQLAQHKEAVEVLREGLRWRDVWDENPPEFQQVLVKLEDGKTETAHRCGYVWITTAGEVKVKQWAPIPHESRLRQAAEILGEKGGKQEGSPDV